MILIPVGVILPIEVRYDATGDSNADSKHINEDEYFVLQKVSERDEEVVFDHGSGLGFKRILLDFKNLGWVASGGQLTCQMSALHEMVSNSSNALTGV
jgi:hypothetical protein